MDVHVLGKVVAIVFKGGREEGQQPQTGDPKILDIIQPLLDLGPSGQSILLASLVFTPARPGVDALRVDAIPYLVERDGTSCENLPETHAIVRKLRTGLIRTILVGCSWRKRPNGQPTCVLSVMVLNSTWPFKFRSCAHLHGSSPGRPAAHYRNHRADPRNRMRIDLGIRRGLAPLVANNRRRNQTAEQFASLFPARRCFTTGINRKWGTTFIWVTGTASHTNAMERISQRRVFDCHTGPVVQLRHHGSSLGI